MTELEESLGGFATAMGGISDAAKAEVTALRKSLVEISTEVGQQKELHTTQSQCDLLLSGHRDVYAVFAEGRRQKHP